MHAAYCYRSQVTCSVVCVLETRVSCAKTAETFEILFEWQIHVNQRNQILDGNADQPREGAFLRGTYDGPM